MRFSFMMSAVLLLAASSAFAQYAPGKTYSQAGRAVLQVPPPPAPRHMFNNCSPSRLLIFYNSPSYNSSSSYYSTSCGCGNSTYFTPSNFPYSIPNYNNPYTPPPTTYTPSYNPPPTYNTPTTYNPPPTYNPPNRPYVPPLVTRPQHGNNGVGNGIDPQPPGNPKPNDESGTGTGKPGNKPSKIFRMKDGRIISSLNSLEADGEYVVKTEKGRFIKLSKSDVLAVKELDVAEEPAIVEK